jgi:hypothetical protein
MKVQLTSGSLNRESGVCGTAVFRLGHHIASPSLAAMLGTMIDALTYGVRTMPAARTKPCWSPSE